MKRIVLSALFISSLMMMGACNNDKNVESNQQEEIATADFVFELEGVFPKNDRFQLFYSNDTNFTEDKSIKVIVYGQTVLQKVTFTLPANVKPQNLRLDLGSNAEQSTVSIKKFTVNYQGKSLEVADEKFRDYFPDTSNVVFDDTKLVYNLTPNVDGIFDPLLLSSDLLKKDLNKIYNSLKEKK